MKLFGKNITLSDAKRDLTRHHVETTETLNLKSPGIFIKTMAPDGTVERSIRPELIEAAARKTIIKLVS